MFLVCVGKNQCHLMTFRLVVTAQTFPTTGYFENFEKAKGNGLN